MVCRPARVASEDPARTGSKCGAIGDLRCSVGLTSRIHGELLKLGRAVSQSTVAKYMVRVDDRDDRRGARSWRTTSNRGRHSEPSGSESEDPIAQKNTA